VRMVSVGTRRYIVMKTGSGVCTVKNASLLSLRAKRDTLRRAFLTCIF